MKIGHLENKPAVTPVATERKGAAGATTNATGTEGQATEASAQVELSAAAAALNVDAGSAEFDSEKVNRITQAIREGKFTVNPEAIADKLISNAHELLSRTSH
jgi:negative regulator of flagellin synthesis FlgM